MHVRTAQPSDAAAMGALVVRAWQAAYRGLMPDDYLDGLTVDDRADLWTRILTGDLDPPRAVFVASDDGGRVVGFVAPTSLTRTSAAGETVRLEPLGPEHNAGHETVAGWRCAVHIRGAAAVPAGAITFGELDGDLHPNVGAVVIDDDGQYFPICSGTLIAPDVFLTAAHCVGEGERLWVSFDSTFDQTSVRHAGTADAHNLFATGGANNTYDIAVIVLKKPVEDIEPAELPEAGLLDNLKADHELRDQTFTAVGYGTVRDDKTGGPHALQDNADRRYALQSALSLQKAWFQLSMQPSTDDGGTCYGDSGGPHFLGGVDSNLVVSITVTGDRFCRATDKTYRLDTTWARDFLDDHVTLP